MKQFWFQILGLVLLSLVAFYVMYNPAFLGILSPGFSNAVPSPQVKVNIVGSDQKSKAMLNIELADTKEKRAQGLSNRPYLATDSGVLFVFDQEGNYQFWMKEMKIPIDFIWINKDTVVDILPNVAPPSPNQKDEELPKFGTIHKIDKVLEVNAGFASRNNIQIGDKLQLINN